MRRICEKYTFAVAPPAGPDQAPPAAEAILPVRPWPNGFGP